MGGYMPRIRSIIAFVVLGMAAGHSWTNELSGQAGSRPSDRSPEQSQGGHSPMRTSTAAVGSPIKPFTDFYQVGDGNAGVDIGSRIAEKARQLNLDIEFLIATVPDPIDSRFAHEFDGLVDSIEEAVQSQGWNLDQFWLPWKPSGDQVDRQTRLRSTMEEDPAAKEREPSSGSAHGELAKLMAEARLALEKNVQPAPETPMQELEPGVLLFRKRETEEEPTRVLFVFLIGETPTAGVHKKALFKSFNLIAQYISSRNGGCAASAPRQVRAVLARIPYVFRVLGPRFSGSERSLSFVISRWIASLDSEVWQACVSGSLSFAVSQWITGKTGCLLPNQGRWRFRVVSGCALKVKQERFTSVAQNRSAIADVCFGATVAPLDRVMSALFRYLDRRNGDAPLEKVALLTESDTEFGGKMETGRWSSALARRRRSRRCRSLRSSSRFTCRRSRGPTTTSDSRRGDLRCRWYTPAADCRFLSTRLAARAIQCRRFRFRCRRPPANSCLARFSRRFLTRSSATSGSWRLTFGIRSFWRGSFTNTAPTCRSSRRGQSPGCSPELLGRAAWDDRGFELSALVNGPALGPS